LKKCKTCHLNQKNWIFFYFLIKNVKFDVFNKKNSFFYL
jgi:hypothetical protein